MSQTATAATAASIDTGDDVRHPWYGRGTVVERRGETAASVRFGNGRTRTVATGNLTVIEPTPTCDRCDRVTTVTMRLPSGTVRHGCSTHSDYALYGDAQSRADEEQLALNMIITSVAAGDVIRVRPVPGIRTGSSNMLVCDGHVSSGDAYVTCDGGPLMNGERPRRNIKITTDVEILIPAGTHTLPLACPCVPLLGMPHCCRTDS